jgi:hypothetical protein
MTKTTLEEILPAFCAFMIAFKFEPLPEAKTHKFKPKYMEFY